MNAAPISPGATPIFRIIHIDNLPTVLARQALHAPSQVPQDGRPWTSIHATRTQEDRGRTPVPCGPGGVILDYVGFYFGPRSPMLYRVHTGHNVARVDQANIVYFVCTAQAVAGARLRFVFTDRHSLARVAAFFDDLRRIDEVDLQTCYARQWNSTAAHPDRQEKKQAEFLVHRSLPWNLIERIGVLNEAARERIQATVATASHRPEIVVSPAWYY